MKKIVQNAGKDQLGKFASDFAHYNDDILFGEVWNNEDIDLKMRSIITVVSLMSQGICDNSLKYHLLNAKNHNTSKQEIASIITHTAFYAGWPKAWAAFNLAKEVWKEDENDLNYENQEMANHAKTMLFPIGDANVNYSKYFIGNSYLYPISFKQVGIYNVTFEPSCRNNWHIHEAKSGGGQILICINGEGYYQEEGKEVISLKPGDVINILPNVKHWHGVT